jgi:hypothetical protein
VTQKKVVEELIYSNQQLTPCERDFESLEQEIKGGSSRPQGNQAAVPDWRHNLISGRTNKETAIQACHGPASPQKVYRHT